MWQIRIIEQDAYAECGPHDTAWLEVLSEAQLRLWSVSFRLPLGWYEQAWLHDSAWIGDRRFAGPRTVLRELVIASPKIPMVAAPRILADLRAQPEMS